MALKRPTESVVEFVEPKIMKLMEANDVVLSKCDLSEDVICILEYDALLKTFSVTIEKSRKGGNRYICLGEEEINTILLFL